ncbi:MAG: hypothetical protein ACLUE1_07790, partial [Adlercreutzia equolifaciens]
PPGKSRSLVPAEAARANRDQAFLQTRGTKSPKLAEIGVLNLDFCQNFTRKGFLGYQTANYGMPRARARQSGGRHDKTRVAAR